MKIVKVAGGGAKIVQFRVFMALTVFSVEILANLSFVRQVEEHHSHLPNTRTVVRCAERSDAVCDSAMVPVLTRHFDEFQNRVRVLNVNP